jgi:hypothetical protein
MNVDAMKANPCRTPSRTIKTAVLYTLAILLGWNFVEKAAWAVPLLELSGQPTSAENPWFEAGNPTEQLYTRWFKLDPERVARVYPAQADGNASVSFIASNLILRFKNVGVDVRPPKNFYYTLRKGMLMVRGTQKDLESVEKSIQEFTSSAPALKTGVPRLRLDVNIVEYPADKGPEVFRLMGLADSPPGSFIDLPPTRRTGPPPEKTPSIVTRLNSPDSPLTWILTKNLNEFILDKLNQSADAQVIAGPRITTSQGARTKVDFEYPGEIIRQLGAMADADAFNEPLDTFPTLYVEPQLKGDGYTIDLKTTQAIRDLVGYDLEGGAGPVWDYVESTGANPAPRDPATSHSTAPPKPIYRLREATGNTEIKAGQTLVLSGLTATTTSNITPSSQSRLPLLGDLPIAGRFFRARTIPPEKKKVLVFITPTILDADGKALHPQGSSTDAHQSPAKQ